MDLPILTSPTTNKPWLNIYVNSVNSKKSVSEYTNTTSGQLSAGMLIQSADMNLVGLPAATGGDTLTLYNKSLKKIVLSGLPGANTAVSTVDGGATWTQLTTPFAFPGISYSPDLNLYSGILIGSVSVYTSPTANNGSWVAGTPYTGPGNLAQRIFYSTAFKRWYTSTTDGSFRVASSTTGDLYNPQFSNRDFSHNAYAPLSSKLGTGKGRLVLVGPDGPQYTDDGKTWINSNSTTPMFSVCYSSFWGKFVALPRAPVDRANIYSSVDGINWTASNAGFETTLELRTIAWSDDLQVFQAAGANSRFWVSSDGLKWKRQAYNFVAGVISIKGSGFYPEIGAYIAGTNLANVVVTSPLFIA